MQKLPELTKDNARFVEQSVTDAVAYSLQKTNPRTAELIDQLRNLEAKARSATVEPQTVQVIASGRRLLGDREDLSEIGRKSKIT